MKWLKDILTGSDNSTYDLGSFLAIVSFIWYFSLSLLADFRHNPWQPAQFAGGIGILVVAFSIHLYVSKPELESKQVMTVSKDTVNLVTTKDIPHVNP